MEKNRKKILLVEDEVVTAKKEEAILKKFGYAVVTVASGEEAVDAISEKSDIDLILMDIDLGDGIDGTEAAEIILQKKEIPIVFLSAHIEPEIVAKTEKITSYGYSVKGSANTVLDASIKMAFKLHKANLNITEHRQELEAGNEEMQQAIEELEATNEHLMEAHREIFERDGELKRSQQFLNDVFHSIQDGISVLDPDLNIQHVNHVMENWYGENMPLKGKKCFHCYHNAEEPCNPCPTLNAIKSGETESIIAPGLPGSPVEWIEVYSYPMKEAKSGKVTGVVEFVRDISDRKKAEDELLKSEERLSLVIKGTDVGLWDWYVQSGKLTINERWAEIVGYTLEELGPISIQTWIDLVHPDDLKKSNELLEKCFSSEIENYWCEVRMKHRDGRWVWILDKGKVMERTTDGKPVRMSGTHTEVTVRKAAQEALKESEERYKGIFYNSPLGIIHFDKEGTITDCNDIFVEIIGSSRDVLIGLNMVTQLKDEKLIQAVRESLRKGEGYYEDLYDSVTSDKSAYVRILFKGLKNEPGEIVSGIGIVEDITDRKKVENELRRNEDKFRNFIENASDIVYTGGTDGIFTYVSPSWKKVLGHEVSDVIGKGFEDFVHPDDISLCAQYLGKVATGEVPFGYVEYRVKHKDGTWRWHTTYGSTLKDEDGKFEAFLGVAHDSTDQKKSEQDLERALKEKEYLLLELQHRVKNSFSMIMSLVNLETDRVNKPEMKDILLKILDRIMSISELYSMLYESKSVRYINLDEYILNIIKSLASSYSDINEKLKINPVLENIVVNVKKAAPIGMIVTELVTNAIKHAFIEKEKGLVSISLKKEESGLVIIVADNGIGFQGKLNEIEPGGMGMKLVQALVRQLDGKYSMDHKEGFSFNLEIPVVDDEVGTKIDI